MDQIVGISIKENKRSLVKTITSIDVIVESGLKGDFRGQGGINRNRQVTVLSLQQWEQACSELGVSLPWNTRRANLCVDGLIFGPENVGKILRIGKDIELEITGETEPCKRMDEAHHGLKDALSVEWRGGVTCRVLKEGVIYLNSCVELK